MNSLAARKCLAVSMGTRKCLAVSMGTVVKCLIYRESFISFNRNVTNGYDKSPMNRNRRICDQLCNIGPY